MREIDPDVLSSWAESGVMALTGRNGQRPLGPPEPLVRGLRRVGVALENHAQRLGAELGFEPLHALGARAAYSRLERGGDVSCSGATRLVRAADGWIAVSLAREDDVAMVPAWLHLDAAPTDPWWTIETRAA